MFEEDVKIDRLNIKSDKDIFGFLNDYFLNSSSVFGKPFKKIDEGLYRDSIGARFKIQKVNDRYFVDIWWQDYKGFILPKNLFFFGFRNKMYIKAFIIKIISIIQSFDENAFIEKNDTIVKGKSVILFHYCPKVYHKYPCTFKLFFS